MKIVKRIPLEAYAYEEITFDSLEEYKTEYPKYVLTHLEVKDQVKNLIKNIDLSFKGDELK
jgi:hypothetical protein